MLRDYDNSVDSTRAWIPHMQPDWHALDVGCEHHRKMMCSIYIDPCYEQHAGRSWFIDMASITQLSRLDERYSPSWSSHLPVREGACMSAIVAIAIMLINSIALSFSVTMVPKESPSQIPE